MRPSRRSRAAAASASALLLLLPGALGGLGCNPPKDALRPENLLARLGHQGGQVIEPKKCMLRVAILDRVSREPAINEVVWRVADQQSIPPDRRRALEANGLRIGRITGELPPELEAVVNAPPPHKVEPATFLVDDGEQPLVSVSDPVDQASLLLNRDGRAYGKDYQAASGYFRVTVRHDGGNAVSLRFAPEIHHGPIQRSFPALAGSGAYNPHELRIADGQQEEVLDDLGATLVLEPGQVAVLGCRPEQERSLGGFLMTRADGHAERGRQKLILIWASRNQVGVVGEKPVVSDRPLLGLLKKKEGEGPATGKGHKPASATPAGKAGDGKP